METIVKALHKARQTC